MAAPDAPDDDWLLHAPTDARQVADRYDEWAERYDDDLAAWSYQAPGVVAETILSRRPDAGAVLDVGCGTGLVGRALRARGYAGRLVGLDISQTSLALARRSGAYDEVESADLQQRLVVDENGVDALVCVGVMTYLPDVERVWREFARVVRPGGIVVVTQREDLWQPRDCQGVVDRMATEGVWTPLELSGPAPYLPEANGDMAELGGYYLTAEIG